MWVKWQMRYEFIFIPVMAGVGGFYFFIREKMRQNYTITDKEPSVSPASLLTSSCPLFLRKVQDDNLEMSLPQQ